MTSPKAAERDRCERMFPIINGGDIPWAMIEPFEKHAQRNHQQSLERLAARGGLSDSEAVAVLEGRHWRFMPDPDARRRLGEFVAEYEAREVPKLRAEIAELKSALTAESAERKRIAEGMRERCARYLDEIKKPGLADCIRALPLKTGGDDGR